MNGHIIEGTPIAVDFWKIRECPNVRLFFLSHVHDDHTKGLTPSWRYPLYTSVVSAKLLDHFVKVPAHLVKALEVGTSHLIPLGEKGEESMTVTLIDAQHCPGAVMFLFEGYFGNILYTGDFRYESSMADDPAFAAFPAIDRLYLDNTYCSPSCTHPTRKIVAEKILETIRTQPPNTRVLLGLTRVGKEDLLVTIAKELKEWIVVDPDAYKKMQILEMSDVFTVDSTMGRIRVMPCHMLNKPNFQYQDSGDDSFIIILPSSIMGSDFRPPYGTNNNVYHMPYSNHSSFPELAAFISKVRPRRIIPIVDVPESRADMSAFENLLDPTPCKSFQTPSTVENWNLAEGGRKLPLVTPKRSRTGAPKMNKGVSFIDEDSIESKLCEKDHGKSVANISDSDCDSDSGIFEVLKKLKPDSKDSNNDPKNKIGDNNLLLPAEDEAPTELKSGIEIPDCGKGAQDESKVDTADIGRVDSAESFSEELIEAPASPDTSKKVDDADLTNAYSSANEIFLTDMNHQGSAAEEASKNAGEDLTLVDSSGTIFVNSNDSPVSQNATLDISDNTQCSEKNSTTKQASKDGGEIEFSLSDSTVLLSCGESSSEKASSQEEQDCVVEFVGNSRVNSNDSLVYHNTTLDISDNTQCSEENSTTKQVSKDGVEIEFCLSDSTVLLSCGESSSAKASSQEEQDCVVKFIGNSRVSTNDGISAPLSDGDPDESGKKIMKKSKLLDTSSHLEIPGPEVEVLVESETGDNMDQSKISDVIKMTKSAFKDGETESGGDKSDNTKRDDVVEDIIGPLLPGDGTSDLTTQSSSSWKPKPCLCHAKWKLEEALQEAMAYLRGEPFRPFVYPDQHICLL